MHQCPSIPITRPIKYHCEKLDFFKKKIMIHRAQEIGQHMILILAIGKNPS